MCELFKSFFKNKSINDLAVKVNSHYTKMFLMEQKTTNTARVFRNIKNRKKQKALITSYELHH